MKALAIALPLLMAAVGLAPQPTEAATPKLITAAPGETVEIVEGQPFALPIEPIDFTTSEGRFAIIGGPVIASDHFPPYGDYIPTRNLRRRGVLPGGTYTLTASAVQFDGTVQSEASYGFVVHPLPVIAKARLEALVVAGQRHIVGLRLRNLDDDARLVAWGTGFGFREGRFRLRLRERHRGDRGRTYTVPGGLRWGSDSNPRIIVSVAPASGAEEFGVAVRGRVLSGLFNTNRRGDTVFKQVDDWRYCSEELTRRGRPPRRADCVNY